MVLKFESKDKPKQLGIESEAFKDTIETFSVSIVDLARDSGVAVDKISKFRKGEANMTTRTLSRLLLALTPTQSSFYGAMVQMLYAAKSAGIEVEEIKFKDIVDITDIYRQSYKIVLDTFNIIQEHFAKKIDIAGGNLGQWKNGSRDFTQESMNKIINGFTIEQRMFYLAIVDILFIVGAERMANIRKKAS